MDERVIHIATATNQAYVPWCATMLRSCLDHHRGDRLAFHLLDAGDLAPDAVDRLRGMVEAEGASFVHHRIHPERLERFPAVAQFGGRVVWSRLLLPELLPDTARVLYLDADTLVVDSLVPLWRTDLGGAPFAAAPNVVEPDRWSYLRSLGVSDPRRVLNSGVLLLDLDALRAGDALESLGAFVGAHPDCVVWADQDALNAVFDGRWLALHPRWNAQNSLWTWRDWAVDVFGEGAVDEATGHPAVVHFEGPHICKPWHYLCQHPWLGAYRATLARTPWPSAPPADRTLVTRAIRQLPPSWWTGAYLRLLRHRDRRAARSAAT